MRVEAALRRELDIAEAVRAELSSRNRLLPPRWGDLALVDNEDLIAESLASSLRREFKFAPEDVLLARKLGRGARPLSILDLPTRILYRSAIRLIESIAGSADRSRAAYEEFQAAPLGVEICTHILKTDIAAYYQYIDHERLVDEVVAQTGNDLPVSAVTELLAEVSGRHFGLPQLSSASDVLGEIYIEPMRRELVRADLQVFRFADDFRVACRSYGDALAALEQADHAARSLGLVLNELKTSTPRRATYEESLTAVSDRERDLFIELGVDALEEPEFEEYGAVGREETPGGQSLLDEAEFDENEVVAGDELENDDGEATESQVEAAREVLDHWVQEDEDDEVQRQERARVTARLLGRALRVFARARDPIAADYVTPIMVYEPSLTPTLARYLLRIAGPYRAEVRNALDGLCSSKIASAWQALWIAYVSGELTRRRGGEERSHVVWLREQALRGQPMLAAEALLALARRGLTTLAEANEVIRQLPAVHRPTGVLALAALGDETAVMAAADSQFDRARAIWGLENL